MAPPSLTSSDGPVSPGVSVVIPTYNRGSLLAGAIDSVLVQHWPVIELVVVDDGSTDETPALLTGYAERHKGILKVVRQSNGGPSSARNAGVLAARHEFIALLDSDNRWEPNKLQRQMQMFFKEPRPDLTFTGYQAVREPDPDTEVILDRWESSQSFALEQLLIGCCINTSTVVARRNCLVESGLFDTTLRCAEDHDAWLRVAAGGYRIEYLAEPLTRYLFHPESVSGDLMLVSTSTERVLQHLFEAGVLPADLQRRRDFYLARCYLNSACRYLEIDEGRAALQSLWRATRIRPRSIRLGWLRLALRGLASRSRGTLNATAQSQANPPPASL